MPKQNSFQSAVTAALILVLFVCLWMIIWPNKSAAVINRMHMVEIRHCNSYLGYAKTASDTLQVLLQISDCKSVVMPRDTLHHK